LLVHDVEVRADGGGHVPSALNALHGRDRAVRFFVGLARKFPEGGTLLRFTTVHGAPGIVSRDASGNLQVTSFEFAQGGLRGVWIVRNPGKLSFQTGVLDRRFTDR
ncbi:MAG: RNA polymerase sigma factor SigJ, partial [Nannocystaceae bacterium]|nr:RNA polymerase sigma factor SigJ [Nannocystaceae bacterium]